jgi:hypothetical protein
VALEVHEVAAVLVAGSIPEVVEADVVATAFQRTSERMRFSMPRSPGRRSSRCGGIVLRYAVCAL